MSSMTRTLVLLFGIVAVSSRAEAEPLFLAKHTRAARRATTRRPVAAC